MTTFDGWDTRYCGDSMAQPPGMISEDYLMHWRTRGSKNGQRRYQNEDGSWTPLGLRLRKEREGWGETRKERKAEKRVQQAEKKAERSKKASERKEALKESIVRNKRRSGLENLSDEELKRKLERAKMEAEYKEITKSPLVKTGEKMVASIIENWGKREDRALTRAKILLDRARIDADVKQAKERTKQAESQAKQAKAQAAQAANVAKQREFEAAKMKEDRKAGLKFERKAGFKRAKKEYKEATFLGGFVKTHTAAKLAKIEDQKEIQKGTSFVRKVIESRKLAKKNNVAYVPELFEGQREYEKSLANLRLQSQQSSDKTKQAPYAAKQSKYAADQAKAQAEAARWAYEREKLHPGGKKK